MKHETLKINEKEVELDKTEHTHPKNGLVKVFKMAPKASKKRSIAVQKRSKRPKMVKKTEYCHPLIPDWMKIS